MHHLYATSSHEQMCIRCIWGRGGDIPLGPPHEVSEHLGRYLNCRCFFSLFCCPQKISVLTLYEEEERKKPRLRLKWTECISLCIHEKIIRTCLSLTHPVAKYLTSELFSTRQMLLSGSTYIFIAPFWQSWPDIKRSGTGEVILNHIKLERCCTTLVVVVYWIRYSSPPPPSIFF